jgi:hypothetical protein
VAGDGVRDPAVCARSSHRGGGRVARIGSLAEDARADLKEAREAVTRAQAEDIRAIAAATAEGEEPEDPGAHNARRRPRCNASRFYTAGSSGQQTRRATSSRMRSHPTVRSGSRVWPRQKRRRSTSTPRPWRRPVALWPSSRRLAREELGQQLDPSQAKTGRYSPFSGGRIRISGRELRINDVDPDRLLALAGRVVDPLPGPKDTQKEVARVA